LQVLGRTFPEISIQVGDFLKEVHMPVSGNEILEMPDVMGFVG
jgi:hypothetical protein